MKIDFNSNIGKCMGKSGYIAARVGLELEYEHCKAIPTKHGKKWHTDMDHSLRTGGLEFVSVPLIRSAVPGALETMLDAAAEIKAKVTKRCGLHVHVNMTHLTWKQMFQFTTYYTLLEPYLFKEFAPGREESHFCVPTWSNTVLTDLMYTDGMRLRQGIRIPGTGTRKNWDKAYGFLNGQLHHRTGHLAMISTPKYAALNLNSLRKFGTLEFRQAPSSLNQKFIEKWTYTLLNILEKSLEYSDPMEIVEEYTAVGIHRMCARARFHPRGLIDTLDQEDAADAASIMAGHKPIDWQQLKWET